MFTKTKPQTAFATFKIVQKSRKIKLNLIGKTLSSSSFIKYALKRKCKVPLCSNSNIASLHEIAVCGKMQQTKKSIRGICAINAISQ